jgi:hypothetical protein
MPKDMDMVAEAALERSPIGGLSEPLYRHFADACIHPTWTRSPVGGLSLPEFLRVLGAED